MLETVQELSKLSSAALAVAKKAMYGWDSMHFDKGLARAEKIYLDELMKIEDMHEGIQRLSGEAAAKVEGKVDVERLQSSIHARSHR